jgi:hypothetical protein
MKGFRRPQGLYWNQTDQHEGTHERPDRHQRWPESLQGKAREFYERYERSAKPTGYKLKAMVVNFPGGIPGDVGFFLNWAPPAR